ncbi:twin transmembrane helix small protein [Amylibacter sp. SFDW26]|uniref:twin transmembrane helix small protein n=1 Tax=Amylibacter sp. SFDW26 TaxID=2652722 RepID=UPI001261F358|nr:twin transmembrane helix small protein [Amylibacter sp. SFDW26]KAB7614827.1 twin transmembrane helix small protein [Amylibacter sp. SFDW26]
MPVSVLYAIVVIAILLVLVILMIGLGGFTTGGDFNRKYANKLMRWRIIAQAFAVALILLYVMLRGNGG